LYPAAGVERGAAGWDALMQNLEPVSWICTYIATEILSDKSLCECRWYPTVDEEAEVRVHF